MNTVTFSGNVVSVHPHEGRTVVRIAVDTQIDQDRKTTLYIDAVAWRDLATRVAGLSKGERVLLTGELRNTPSGPHEVLIRDVGRSERFK